MIVNIDTGTKFAFAKETIFSLSDGCPSHHLKHGRQSSAVTPDIANHITTPVCNIANNSTALIT
jgi:hypothetical protein